jgi:hypothetical protein
MVFDPNKMVMRPGGPSPYPQPPPGSAGWLKEVAMAERRAARRTAHRAPVVAKAQAAFASGREERREVAMAKALAAFEAKEARIKEWITVKSHYGNFVRALFSLGLDRKGDERQRRS